MLENVRVDEFPLKLIDFLLGKTAPIRATSFTFNFANQTPQFSQKHHAACGFNFGIDKLPPTEQHNEIFVLQSFVLFSEKI